MTHLPCGVLACIASKHTAFFPPINVLEGGRAGADLPIFAAGIERLSPDAGVRTRGFLWKCLDLFMAAMVGAVLLTLEMLLTSTQIARGTVALITRRNQSVE